MRNLLLFIALLISSLPVLAERPLPEDGIRARVTATLPLPQVQLNGKLYRLAPGCIIRDDANRKIVHGELPAGAPVMFLRDPNGEVSRIWVLTADEQASLAPAGKR